MNNLSFSNYFNNCLDNIIESKVSSAMKYSLFSNGKMIRSTLLLILCKAYNINEEISYPLATTIELVHAYSLIHDDLPALDNDILRRGKNTCHIQYDQATAILAGDALLTYAFKELSSINIEPKTLISIINLFSEYIGANGMIYGQINDLYNNDNTLDYLIDIYKNKTGKLFQFVFETSGIIIKDHLQQDILKKIGQKIGIVFQFQDDLLELTQSSLTIGKNNHSDIDNNKLTIANFYNINQIKLLINEYYQDIYNLISSLNINTNDIINYIKDIQNRKY